MLKTFTIDFLKLAIRSSLRGDFRFLNYFQKPTPYKFCFFKNFIIKISNGKDIAKNNYVPLDDSNIIYPTVNNIKFSGLILDKVTAIDNEFSSGYYISDNDIVLTRSGTVGITKCWNTKEINETLGKSVEAIPSGYLIVVKLNQKKINPKFSEYYFNSSLLNKYFLVFGVGKSQRNIAQDDVKFIPFPLIPKPKQDQIVVQIELIEKKIKELKAQITSPQKVINKVFARKFGFDLEKFEEMKKKRFFEVEFAKVSNYHSLRYDVKNQKYLDIFNNIIKSFGNSFFLKAISKDKGKYGANEPAKDGEKEVDTRYIRITDINSIGNLINSDWKTAEKIDEQYLLKDDDFLFARSGNTVGKTFLYDSKKHEEAIYAGYFIKFQLDFTILNKLFFLYYTKSFIYDFWVKGIVRIKGQPNINANEYLELKIPNIPLKSQQKIVDEIKAELDKQEEYKHKIVTQRNKIDKIIEKAIKES